MLDIDEAIVNEFATPALRAGGFVTALVPVTLTALNARGEIVGIARSAFFSNLALSGDPGTSPNEWLEVTFAGGITRVDIERVPSAPPHPRRPDPCGTQLATA